MEILSREVAGIIAFTGLRSTSYYSFAYSAPACFKSVGSTSFQ